MNALDPGERQAEAADAGASVWVAASAGTGKTTVLANRVLALMLGGGPPERILCLTFTKAAAAEMANRINDNLSRWVSLGDGALHQELHRLTGSLPGPETLARARRLFALVLDAPGGMKIATIHAFCQSLLRRFPLEAGVAPHFEVMDERSAADAQNLVRDRVLARARSGEDEALAAALAEVTRHVREEGFATLMKALTLDRARLDEALGEGHAAFMTRLARCLEVDIQSSEADILAAACASGAFDEAALKAAARSLMESDKVTDQRQGGKLAAWLAEPTERADRFEAYLGIFFTLQGKPRDRVMTASLAKRRPSAAAALDAEGARLAAVVAQRRAQALFQASDALVRLGHAIVSAYAAYKADRALLDYDDLVLGARNLLRQPDVAPWVLFKLDGGLDHILIDEAQDTNPWQWEVVASLTEEFFAGEGARPLGRTVFAVGDAKQSIFSFQRADPESFLRMRRHFADRVRGAGARWKVIDLDMSFRSTEAVLTAVDAVFAAAGRAVEGVALDGAPIRHTPFRQGAAGLVELWPPVEVIEAEAPPPWELPLRQHQKAAPSTRLAKAMAAQMRAWFEGGERLEARDRVMRPRDVMVLVRRRGSFVGDLVRALKSNGVEVAGADRMELTQQLVVQDMMALGAFLVLPEDDLTLATVLKGPRFGFDDARLFDLAFERKEPRLWHELRRRAGENDAYHRAASELGDFLARADRVPPFELFAGILSADGGRREVLARLGPDAADPLDEFLAAALAYERTHPPSLQGFLHWLDVGEAEIKRELAGLTRDEVRIMTVHGSKGLEAPVVFLPDTVQESEKLPNVLWTEDSLPLWLAHRGCGAPLSDRATALAIERRDQEYRRLLYVALTRAEDRLYVCGWRNQQKMSATCWYALVQEGLSREGRARKFAFDMPLLPEDERWRGEGWRLTNPQEGKAKPDHHAPARDQGGGELPPWARARPLPEPTPPKPLAPSKPRHADPPARSPLGSDGGEGFRRGRLIHRLLQFLPERPAAERPDLARRFLAQSLHELSPGQQREILGETLAVLDHPEFAPLFGAGSRAEVPVVGLLGGRVLSGQIDRLVVGEGSVLILDYKTLRPPPLDEEGIPEAYLEQLAAYHAAVRSIYPGHEVRAALLWTDGPRLMPVAPHRLARYTL